MPKRPRSHILENLSRTRLRQAFEQMGWTVEDLAKDYGEDLLVRLFENNFATPYSFFVQAKATETLKNISRKEKHALIRVETGHVRHWTRFSEPVFLTLWDSSSDITYWVCVQDVLDATEEAPSKRERAKTMQFRIPLKNVLNEFGLRRIGGIAKLRFNRLAREREGREILIEAIEKMGGTVDSFSPDNGIVRLTYPDGESYLVFFGYLARLLNQIRIKTGLNCEDCLHEGLQILGTKIANGTLNADSIRDELALNKAHNELMAFEDD